MCVQTVGLLAAAIEREGIATVCITLLRDVTETNRPPRALCVPFQLGFPLGRPHDAELQTDVVRRALALPGRIDVPVLADY